MSGSSASTFINPQATIDQLLNSSSQFDAIPTDLESSLRFTGAKLTQAAGILLRSPQEVVAHAIVLFLRFSIGPEGGSFLQYGIKEISAGCMYLASKLSSYPQTIRDIVNVYAYLSSGNSTPGVLQSDNHESDAVRYYVSEGTYQTQRALVLKMEACVLRTLGFETHVVLPHKLAINYLQALDLLGNESSAVLANRVNAHLNSALLSTQLLYVTHQPTALATAAVYIAAREIGVKLPADEWWEVFDVDREELGYLVVALMSIEKYAYSESIAWRTKVIPLTVSDLHQELQDREMLNSN